MKYLNTEKVTNLRQFININNYDYNYWNAVKTGQSIIDISSFDTSKVTNCVGMLHELHDNVTIKISNKFTKCRDQIPYYSRVINVDDKVIDNSFVAVYNVTNISKPTLLLNLEGKYMTNTDFDVFVDGEKVETEVKIVMPYGNYYHYLSYTFKTLGLNKVKIVFKRTPSTMANLFYACFDLVSVDFSETFDSSKVQSMKYMFGQCTSLKSVNVSSFDTRSVGDFMTMFEGCKEIASLDLSNFNTENAFIFQSFFDSMSNLEYLDISSFYSPYLASSTFINGEVKDKVTVVLGKKTNGIYFPSGWKKIYKD
jgi:surface protein